LYVRRISNKNNLLIIFSSLYR